MSMDLTDMEFPRIFSEDVEKDLESTVSDFPDRCSEIFRMCRMDNLSNKEISKLLMVS
jgi:DNA-directed RNA polymerase specialized sigma24 family protein